VGKIKNAYKIMVEKPELKKVLGHAEVDKSII
jgi:hypothetical protein